MKQGQPEVGARGATCRKSDGTPCPQPPMKGSTVCSFHLPNPAARAKAKVRAELAAWSITDVTLDPETVALRLMTQSYNRAAYYGHLLELLHDDTEADLVKSIRLVIGHRKAVSSDGVTVEVAEIKRGLIALEGEERDRAMRFAMAALGADIAGRMVRLEEAKAAMLVTAIRLVLTDLGIDPGSPEAVAVMGRRLRELDGPVAA